MEQEKIQLRDWQSDFVERYLAQLPRRSRLVAEVGSGKTVTALHLAKNLLQARENDFVVILTEAAALREHWRHIGAQAGISLATTTEEIISGNFDGICLAAVRVPDDAIAVSVEKLNATANMFVIYDEAHRSNRGTEAFVTRLVETNARSRLLALVTPHQSLASKLHNVDFDTEYLFHESAIQLRESRQEITRLSPSHSVLHQLLVRGASIDSLSWRQFEKLIAELLEKDGYDVELTRGTKDGGVDVIAMKDLGPAGYFKTLWQAKKKEPHNKVGISLVRELADTRLEMGASKAIIVTTTFLTSGALKRVQRDRYWLDKVDRHDLDIWVSKVLQGN